MHTHLRGKCSHRCCYCYASRPSRGHPSSQEGAIRLEASELAVRYGSGKVIFIEHLNDLFADGVAHNWIEKILDHCREWMGNSYVFQTKNPERMREYVLALTFPAAIGVTLETSRYVPLAFTSAPSPRERAEAFAAISDAAHIRRFATCEPIMDCDPDVLADLVAKCRADWVNIGADSKGHHLPEPSAADLCELIRRLRGYGLEVRLKANLRRLLPQLTDVEWDYWVGGAA
jgi:DNA repair photolyase